MKITKRQLQRLVSEESRHLSEKAGFGFEPHGSERSIKAEPAAKWKKVRADAGMSAAALEKLKDAVLDQDEEAAAAFIQDAQKYAKMAYASLLGETTMKLTVKELRSIVGSVLQEAPKKAKKGSRKEAPSSKMKRIVDALRRIGYKVTGRERNKGAMKVWMKDVDQSTPQVIGLVSNALAKARLSTEPGFEPGELIGKGFRVSMPNEEQGDYLFIAVYAGPRAEEEESGVDTTDLDLY